MMTFTYIAAAIILLGLCIFIHELGHLLGGKMVGIKARTFSLGYGKGFLKKTVGDTTYQVTLIPFGGYCQFYGDDPSEPRSGKPYEFFSAAPWRRIITVLMGPLFNLFFGIILFFVMNMVGYSRETNRIFIPEYMKKQPLVSAAFNAGLRDGDEIVEINGKKIRGFTDIQSEVMFSDGEPLNVGYRRNEKHMNVTLRPHKSEESGRYSIGVVPYGRRIVIAGLLPGDIAEKSGLHEMDEILNVDGKKIYTPSEFIEYMRDKSGKKVHLDLLRTGREVSLELVPRTYLTYNIVPDASSSAKKISIGETVIDRAIKNESLRFNNVQITSRGIITAYIKQNPTKNIILELDGEKFTGRVSLEKRGFIGVYPSISPEMVTIKLGIVDSFVRALIEPYEFIVMNIKGMAMLFSGEMDVRENLSGPIRIAKMAGDVAYYRGIAAFVILMAKISIILMVMNLLPIPVVDGSHIVFYMIEWVRGKPISTAIMERIQTAGVFFLIGLAVFIIINDLSMLPAIQKIFQ